MRKQGTPVRTVRSLSYRRNGFPGNAERAKINQTGLWAVCLAPLEHFTGASHIDLLPLGPAFFSLREGCAVNYRGNGRSVDPFRNTHAGVCDVANRDY